MGPLKEQIYILEIHVNDIHLEDVKELECLDDKQDFKIYAHFLNFDPLLIHDNINTDCKALPILFKMNPDELIKAIDRSPLTLSVAGMLEEKREYTVGTVKVLFAETFAEAISIATSTVIYPVKAEIDEVFQFRNLYHEESGNLKVNLILSCFGDVDIRRLDPCDNDRKEPFQNKDEIIEECIDNDKDVHLSPVYTDLEQATPVNTLTNKYEGLKLPIPWTMDVDHPVEEIDPCYGNSLEKKSEGPFKPAEMTLQCTCNDPPPDCITSIPPTINLKCQCAEILAAMKSCFPDMAPSTEQTQPMEAWKPPLNSMPPPQVHSTMFYAPSSEQTKTPLEPQKTLPPNLPAQVQQSQVQQSQVQQSQVQQSQVQQSQVQPLQQGQPTQAQPLQQGQPTQAQPLQNPVLVQQSQIIEEPLSNTPTSKRADAQTVNPVIKNNINEKPPAQTNNKPEIKTVSVHEIGSPEVNKPEESYKKIQDQKETTWDERKHSIKKEYKKKRKDIKNIYEYTAGMYPGMVVGHKYCLPTVRLVPKNMGWLWNLAGLFSNTRSIVGPTDCHCRLNPRCTLNEPKKGGRGWRPGAILKTVAQNFSSWNKAAGFKEGDEVETFFNFKKKKAAAKTENGIKAKKIKEKGKDKDKDKDPDPDPDREEDMDMDRDDQENFQPKPTLHVHKKDKFYHITMNPPGIDSHTRPISFKVDPRKGSSDEETSSESTSDDSFEFEYTVPAGLIPPPRKVNRVSHDTQYNPEDFLPIKDSKDKEEEKTSPKEEKVNKNIKGGAGKGGKKKGKKK